MNIRVIRGEDAERFIVARLESGLVLSALNLFMLGFLRRYRDFPQHAVFWCDGLMGSLYTRLKGGMVRKFRGVEMLRAILSAHKGRTICILGSCGESAKRILSQYHIEVVQHYSLESFDLDSFDYDAISLSSDAIIIALPSPKQELLALRLASVQNNSHKHFYCIGGALNMLANPELDCPWLLQVLGLEFLFRLRTDTLRRLSRLFSSLLLALMNIAGLFKYGVTVIKK